MPLAEKATLEPATVELYGRLHTKLKEFAPNITVRSIDKNFVREWEQWLKHEKGLCQNTAIASYRLYARFIKAK